MNEQSNIVFFVEVNSRAMITIKVNSITIYEVDSRCRTFCNSIKFSQFPQIGRQKRH